MRRNRRNAIVLLGQLLSGMTEAEISLVAGALLGPKQTQCQHTNTGTVWQEGIKKVVCNNCHRVLWQVRVN